MFIQPEISDKPMGNPHTDFETLCRQVQSVRAANPRFGLNTDLNVIRNEVDHQNALRVLGIKGAESYLVEDGQGGSDPKSEARPHNQRLGVVEGGRRISTGAAVLHDWLGEGGKPVVPALAVQRAEICVTCPKNGGGDWTTRFTTPAVEHIRRQLSLRREMDLKTPDDDNLGVCTACSCPLKLKVWTPLKHILAHTSELVKTDLDSRCWILREKTE